MMRCKKDLVNYLLEKLEIMYPEARCALNYSNNYELLVAVLLSSQTTDKAVNKVTSTLFEKYPAPSYLMNADLEELENILKSLGLYKNKARNLISLAWQLCEKKDGNVPNSLDELMKLSGVGYKTASVVLIEGFDLPAFPVDTHIKRILNRIGLVNELDPTKISKKCLKLFPSNSYKKAHHQLIYLGRNVCKASNPKCLECLINKECKYYLKAKNR